MKRVRTANGAPTPTPTATIDGPDAFEVTVAVAVVVVTEEFPMWTSVEASVSVVPSKQQLLSVPQQYAPLSH